MIDLGSRLRLIAAEVDAVPPDRPMPKLPVARAMWVPRPDFKRGCEAWILAGGAHHVSFSRAVTISHLEDFAAMAGIELIHIGAGTESRGAQERAALERFVLTRAAGERGAAVSAGHRELRELALAANLEIPRRGLAIRRRQCSAFDPAHGVLAIKPSGVPYDELTVDGIVVVDLEGRVVEGRLRPSSDTRTHIVLYRSFTGITGIAHTHSTYATGWAQARAPIPLYGTTHADHFRGSVPVTRALTEAEIDGDYEERREP